MILDGARGRLDVARAEDGEQRAVLLDDPPDRLAERGEAEDDRHLARQHIPQAHQDRVARKAAHDAVKRRVGYREPVKVVCLGMPAHLADQPVHPAAVRGAVAPLADGA